MAKQINFGLAQLHGLKFPKVKETTFDAVNSFRRPVLWQRKRYVPYDAYYQDGKRVSVVTDPSLPFSVSVTGGQRPVQYIDDVDCREITWLDENGRAIQ